MIIISLKTGEWGIFDITTGVLKGTPVVTTIINIILNDIGPQDGDTTLAIVNKLQTYFTDDMLFEPIFYILPPKKYTNEVKVF